MLQACHLYHHLRLQYLRILPLSLKALTRVCHTRNRVPVLLRLNHRVYHRCDLVSSRLLCLLCRHRHCQLQRCPTHRVLQGLRFLLHLHLRRLWVYRQDRLHLLLRHRLLHFPLGLYFLQKYNAAQIPARIRVRRRSRAETFRMARILRVSRQHWRHATQDQVLHQKIPSSIVAVRMSMVTTVTTPLLIVPRLIP